jgi:hypothetical protein
MLNVTVTTPWPTAMLTPYGVPDGKSSSQTASRPAPTNLPSGLASSVTLPEHCFE